MKKLILHYTFFIILLLGNSVVIEGSIKSYNTLSSTSAVAVAGGWWVVHFDYNDSTSCYRGGASCCPGWDCPTHQL